MWPMHTLGGMLWLQAVHNAVCLRVSLCCMWIWHSFHLGLCVGGWVLNASTVSLPASLSHPPFCLSTSLPFFQINTHKDRSSWPTIAVLLCIMGSELWTRAPLTAEPLYFFANKVNIYCSEKRINVHLIWCHSLWNNETLGLYFYLFCLKSCDGCVITHPLGRVTTMLTLRALQLRQPVRSFFTL